MTERLNKAYALAVVVIIISLIASICEVVHTKAAFEDNNVTTSTVVTKPATTVATTVATTAKPVSKKVTVKETKKVVTTKETTTKETTTKILPRKSLLQKKKPLQSGMGLSSILM